jgi:hypothetical protein
MKSILNVGRDTIVELRLTGNPELLKQLFNQRTKAWKYHLISGEYGTSGIFCDLEGLDGTQGFNLIPTAVSLVLEQDGELFITALALLCQCIGISKTTEMPESLTEKWRDLEENVSNINDHDCDLYWEHIKKWYRVK